MIWWGLHMLNGWQGRGMMCCVGRVVGVIHATLLFATSFGRAPTVQVPRGSHPTTHLVFETSATLLISDLLYWTGFVVPFPTTLHG